MKKASLSDQMKEKATKPVEKEPDFQGNFSTVISTGSTLLDLAISGKRIRGGAIPGGVMLVVYGPSQSGKTALLSEIAGNILNSSGDVQFHDPESRLDQEFASIFGMRIKEDNYHTPDLIPEVFKAMREWKPENKDVVNGIFADSLAALSTITEMENDEGDKMGGRRAKEFSQELRKHARIIKDKNYIFACSNQIREKMDAQKFESKVTFPGGKALWFYSSIVIRFNTPEKIYKEIVIEGKKVKKEVGIEVELVVEKSVDAPYRKAPLIIMYGYGIDDIRANLQYVKDYKNLNTYQVN
ncbi:MAG TPA: hypothetical protein VLS94_06415, partial [Fusibacter sp.]|nr:hypothetical protein [Fusibacter sp.]